MALRICKHSPVVIVLPSRRPARLLALRVPLSTSLACHLSGDTLQLQLRDIFQTSTLLKVILQWHSNASDPLPPLSALPRYPHRLPPRPSPIQTASCHACILKASQWSHCIKSRHGLSQRTSRMSHLRYTIWVAGRGRDIEMTGRMRAVCMV